MTQAGYKNSKEQLHAALDKVTLGLVDEHVRHCRRDAGADPDAQVDELMDALGRMLRQ